MLLVIVEGGEGFVEAVGVLAAQIQADFFHAVPPRMPRIVIHFGYHKGFRIISIFFFFFFFFFLHRDNGFYGFSRFHRLSSLSSLSSLYSRLCILFHRLRSLSSLTLLFHTL